jgi:RIO kinase 1
MANHHYTDLDKLEELENLPFIRNMPATRQRAGKKRRSVNKPKGSSAELVAEQADGQENFNFTYNASRHEREWILNSLGGFHEGRWLDDVLRLIKGGKEAHVYQCQANPSVAGLRQPLIAAKVYRPRRFRNLKNDHVYRQGRALLDSDGRLITDNGMLHAIHRRTGYGLDLLHSSWIEHEYSALSVLHAAGADVPLPLERGDNAILMDYIGDEGVPAPTLNSINLAPDEARSLFERVLRNIEIMLAQGRVHGDLSAYNILYWQGEITLIDFPQVVEPQVNHNAFKIFERDVVRVCEYFARQGVRSSPRKIAVDLWTSYGYQLDI